MHNTSDIFAVEQTNFYFGAFRVYFDTISKPSSNGSGLKSQSLQFGFNDFDKFFDLSVITEDLSDGIEGGVVTRGESGTHICNSDDWEKYYS